MDYTKELMAAVIGGCTFELPSRWACHQRVDIPVSLALVFEEFARAGG